MLSFLISANVEEISKTLDGDADVVIPSLYDTEELSEDQRLQMCRRGIQTVPEMNFQISEDASSGLSKYYAVITRSQRKTDDPTKNLTFMQAFECPTEPKIYIHVNYGRGKAHTLLTIVKEDATELRPAFDIMGYEILPVVSIDVYEGKFFFDFVHIMGEIGIHSYIPITVNIGCIKNMYFNTRCP